MEIDEGVARALDRLVDVPAGVTGDWLEVIRLAALDAWYRPASDVDPELPRTEPERAGRDGSGELRGGKPGDGSRIAGGGAGLGNEADPLLHATDRDRPETGERLGNPPVVGGRSPESGRDSRPA